MDQTAPVAMTNPRAAIVGGNRLRTPGNRLTRQPAPSRGHFSPSSLRNLFYMRLPNGRRPGLHIHRFASAIRDFEVSPPAISYDGHAALEPAVSGGVYLMS